MILLTEFAGQNWLITPAALAVGEPHPESIHDQKFLLVLSGVVLANLEGNSSSNWLHETLSFLPDMAGPQNSGPLNWAIGRFGIPRPSGQNFTVGFSLEEWAPFASLSSIFNQNQSIHSEQHRTNRRLLAAVRCDPGLARLAAHGRLRRDEYCGYARGLASKMGIVVNHTMWSE